MRLVTLAAALAGTGAMLTTGPAAAGAFALREGSASAQGAALAGRSSGDRDVSFIQANPAALRGVARGEVSNGVAAVYTSTDARMSGTVTGFRTTDTPGTLGFVPSLTAGWRVSPEVVLGFAIEAPFGLATRYEEDFAGSFDAIDSELLTVAATPMIAWSATPWLTLGAGLTLHYADARLTNRTSFATVGKIEGDGFAPGFLLGALVEPLPGTVIGLRYRAGFSHKLSGQFSPNYAVIDPGTGLPRVLSGAGQAEFDLPASANIGITQSLGPRWRLMAEAEWTDWSVYDAVTITESASGFAVRDVQDYRDSWLFAVGAEYDAAPGLTLRAGVAYDQTPVQDATRTLRVPDSDKLWLAAGLSWAVTGQLSIDAAYTALIGVEDPVATVRFGPDAGQTVRFDTTAHEIGINLRWRF